MIRLLQRIATGLTAIALAIGLAAHPVSAQQSKNNIRMGLAARDVGSMDPAFAKGLVDEFVVRQIFNTLISPPDGTLKVELDQVQGELADSWDVSPDSKKWTFHLRKGVKWQKGYGEVTSEDVKFSFMRQVDPKTGAPYAASFDIIDTIDTPDDYTVVFNLKRGSAFFHVTSLLPRFGPYIVPKAAVEKLGEDFAHNPVGSGAFEFVSYEPKQNVKLKANADYWKGKPAVDSVDLFLMPETAARTLAFLNGDLEIIEGARAPGWTEDLANKKKDAIFDALRPGSVQTVFLKLTQKPFDDLKVRQALAYATNPAVWKKAFGVLSGPLYGAASEEFYGGLSEADVPDDLRYAPDIDKAKKLLAEAGHPDGFSFDAFISEREDYKTNMLLLQDQWRKIGVNIRLRVVDHASYHADNFKDLNTIVIYSTSQPPIVVPILEAFYTSDSIVGKPSANRNFSHYGDVGGSIDDALKAAIAEPDGKKQVRMLKDIQLQILRDLPVIPLQTLAVLFVRQPDLDIGFKVEAGLGHYPLWSAKFVK